LLLREDGLHSSRSEIKEEQSDCFGSVGMPESHRMSALRVICKGDVPGMHSREQMRSGSTTYILSPTATICYGFRR
jgi:hypothetical protein